MISTLDINVLVFAVDEQSPFHGRARAFLARIFESGDVFYLFWPTIMGFLRISTSQKILGNPLSMDAALDAISTFLSLPNVRSEAEDARFWRHFTELAAELPIRGDLVPDAHVVALMRQHGVSTIYTHDRDFRKFDGLRVIDPLV